MVRYGAPDGSIATRRAGLFTPMRYMRNAGGYVKVYRSMLEWEWYDDATCSRVMLHLLLSANREPKEWHGRVIEPGQFVASIEGIAGKLRLSRSAIRRALDKLKVTGEVSTQTNNHWTIITLANWAEYQEQAPTSSRQKSRPPTDHRPTTDRPADTTKEVEKGRREELSPNGESGAGAKTLFANCKFAVIDVAKAALPDLVNEGVDIAHYLEIIRNWSDAKDQRRNERGWLATVRQWTKTDRDKGQLRKVVKEKPVWNPRA